MTRALDLTEYPAFLESLKERIRGAHVAAARAVNRELILLYWDLGEAIARKQPRPGGVTRSSIGVIFCAERDEIEVEFALKSKTNPISVAEYQLQSRLPDELKGRMPTARQLADIVRENLPSKESSGPEQ